MLYYQFDWHEFDKIEWDIHVYFWLGVAILIYAIRHIALSARLKLLSDNFFDWKKSIELIFIWEFSSSVSPTSIGGSAVALFFLSKEALATSKSITIVLYSIVLDSLFFQISMPVLLFFLGPIMIRPELTSVWEGDQHFIIFVAVYFIMMLYSAFIFYGLFIKPEHIRKFLYLLSKLRILKRFKRDIIKTGVNVVVASKNLAHKKFTFHLKAFALTSIGWTLRFAVVNALLIAFTSTNLLDLLSQLIIYARSESMYIETSFSPTPGSAGIAEYVFSGFFRDYLPVGLAVITAIMWRIITYYFYLFAGTIIIPNWIRKIFAK